MQRSVVFFQRTGVFENISAPAGIAEPIGRYTWRRSTSAPLLLPASPSLAEGEVLTAVRRWVPSNFIEKYLGKSRRTKVVLLAQEVPPFLIRAPVSVPSLATGFVPLDHPALNGILPFCRRASKILPSRSNTRWKLTLLISAYQRLCSLLPLSLFALSSPLFSSVRSPSFRAAGFLFWFQRAAPTVCRGAPL